MLTRTFAVACLIAVLVAGCGDDDDVVEPQGRPTLSDPASVPTAVPDEERDPYIIDPPHVYAPGDTPPATVEPEPQPARTYVVREGDNCGAIAAQHNISVAELLAANPRINEDCTNLHVDETLNIPPADPDVATEEVVEERPGSGRTYIVVPGDTCVAIAQDHDISVQTFMVANGLDEESCLTLQVGQEVTIPE
ncbi:MAG: LysM peptidoglycan-binding domain-containing protein [Dehalococcoidia bacterium]|nr:LysM peptidoglycan-binding domain-containing protein [Dehalococcoidia bacterium]